MALDDPLYLDPPIETDPQTLAEDAFEHIQSHFPGWVPNDGNLETIIIEANARLAAEVRDVASSVPRSIFRYFGSLVGETPNDATFAEVVTTWTAENNLGYTIAAGTQVGIRTAGDVLVPFVTDDEYIIAPGSTVRNDVRIIAAEPGSSASGIGSTNGEVELIDTLSWVAAITQNTITASGQDADTDEEFLNRLTGQLRLLSYAPILPDDFAALAIDRMGSGRALAIDGYNPGDQTSNNERMVAVAVVTDEGTIVSAPVKSDVDAYLQSLREVNFVVNLIDPTFTAIDVNVTVNALPGYDAAAVEADVEAALAAYLSPATWGRRDPVGDQSEGTIWENNTVVRHYELVALVNSVPGVDYVEAGLLTLRKDAEAFAAADETITGVAPLTTPGTITATVNP